MQPHFPDIVKFVYDHRFATAAQVQQRFPEQIRSPRSAQYQLSALVELGYLATAPVRSISPNFPYVYYATRRGLRLVREVFASESDSPVVATEQPKLHGMSRDFLLHELMLTEFDLAVWRSVQANPHLDRLFVERRYFRRDRALCYRHCGRTRRIIPDSGFLLATHRPDEGRSTLLLHFTELDNGTMSSARLLDKFRGYEHWHRSPESNRYLHGMYGRYGERYSRPTFRLLVIVHANAHGDQRRLAEIARTLESLPNSLRKRIWFTTAAAVRRYKPRQLLASPIWQRCSALTIPAALETPTRSLSPINRRSDLSK